MGVSLDSKKSVLQKINVLKMILLSMTMSEFKSELIISNNIMWHTIWDKPSTDIDFKRYAKVLWNKLNPVKT